MKLPTETRPGTSNPEAFPWLIVGQEGVGKTSLLASQQLWCKEHNLKPPLLIDPMAGSKAHSVLVVELGSWNEHLQLAATLEIEAKKGPLLYSWIQLDLLNVSYDYAYDAVLTKMGLQAPAESKDMGSTWNIITREFVKWLRRIFALGLPIIATAHVNYVEFKKRGGGSHHRAIPFFVGGSGTSTYSHMMKMFDIIGFMTHEAFEVPVATTQTKSTISKAVDVRKERDVLQEGDRRVIQFYLSDSWIAKPGRYLPETVVLPTNWEDDWDAIMKAWDEGVKRGGSL